MRVIRWILFIPAAFVASVIIGALAKWVTDGFFGLEWLGWSTGGGFSAAAFIFIGIKVAPRKSNVVKWVLIVITLLLGLLSAFGAFIGDNPISSLAGIAMVLLGAGFARMDVSEITEAEEVPEQ
jgi:hypothetical protein